MNAVQQTMPSLTPPLTLVAAHARRPTAVERAAEVKATLGDEWLPRLYSTRILPLRTRSHHLEIAERENTVEVQHTLLGVELKTGRRRLLCPDFSTARYLSAFARIGCQNVAVPYDITQISRLADELESSWQRMLLLINQAADERTASFRARLRALLVKSVRDEIKQAGAGAAVPQFNQNTKQRRS
jgi:hypothetical protein